MSDGCDARLTSGPRPYPVRPGDRGSSWFCSRRAASALWILRARELLVGFIHPPRGVGAWYRLSSYEACAGPMLRASAWPMFGALRRTQERLCRVTRLGHDRLLK